MNKVKIKDVFSDLTMRDYFAAHAMIGLMSMDHASEFVDEDDGFEMDYEKEGSTGTLFIHTKWLAVEAYIIADQMIKQRKK